ncbi:N-6 DNA methylase [Acinetobacter baumannii]
MDDSMKHSLLQDPTKYGISENMLIQFSEKEPLYVHLSYLDLFTNEIDKRPDAVVEINGRAALYLVSENIFTIDELRQLKEILASRADARFLGVLRAGVIDIYPLGIFSEYDDQPIVKKIDLSESSINLHDFLIGNLTDKLYKKNNQRKVEQSWLENYLFRLLQTTARNLRENISANKLTDNQILSLVGRALFTRFLIDRKIIVDSDVGNISNKTSKLNNLFNSVSSISDTFAWLDKTFNGNLLPLGNFYYNSEDYNEFFSQIGDESEHICFELQDILLATINRQMSLDWGRIQFQHVPADMLSQVYEHFAHAYQNEFARKTSIHYTPSHIAKILVDSAFDGLEIEDKSSAQILDPSAGAGVFLVLAFKRLVLEKWKITGERPTRNQTFTNLIREMHICFV